MAYHTHFSTRETDQSEKIPGSTQVPNAGGGFAWAVTPLVQVERFLVLGAEGGTYYASEKKLTQDNATAAHALLNGDSLQDAMRVLALAKDVSFGGRAHKNEPALFVLAMATASKHVEVRRAAWQMLPMIARTGTHLFQFIEYRQAFGGWGRAVRRGVANWYTEKTAEKVAFLALKYPQRGGMSHRDALRLAHPKTADERLDAVFSAITHPDGGVITNKRDTKLTERTHSSIGDMGDTLPSVYEGVLKVRAAKGAAAVAALVEQYGLHREMLPTEWLNDPTVYWALLQHMPMTAMIRNLRNMAKMGLLTPMSDASKLVCEKLDDEETIRKARVHPLAILIAQRAYAGKMRSRSRAVEASEPHTVVPQVIDALEAALMKSFKFVEPTGKRFVIGVDVSSSMSYSFAGDTGITACEVAAMMALVTAKTEQNYFISGFADTFRPLSITAKSTFDSAARAAQLSNFGSTDCSLPMVHALKNQIPADVFLVITDNETNTGRVHPAQALRTYREQTGIAAKSVVMACTSGGFTIADPNDRGMLDVVGCDASVPAVVADFARS